MLSRFVLVMAPDEFTCDETARASPYRAHGRVAGTVVSVKFPLVILPRG